MAEGKRLALEFLTSAPDLARCPKGSEPEVALAGRSNAGKSSVLNRLAGSRATARTSKTPGRTRMLNFFALPGGARLVDLPGYGYAKAAAGAQAQWQSAVNDYLSRREQLAGVILVTDIRHPGMAFDEDLIRWATASAMPLHILLNKADKLKRGRQAQALARYRQRLSGSPTAQPSGDSRGRPQQDRQRLYAGPTVQLFSAANGTGLDDLLGVIDQWFAGPPTRSS